MSEVEYLLNPVSTRGHRIIVQCRIPDGSGPGAIFRLAAWTPGSYLIRDYARHVLRAAASSGDNALRLSKIDKHSWQVEPVAGPVCLELEFYAREDSVRGAYLDEDRGLFDGAGIFPRADGYEDSDCRIEIRPPGLSSDWSLATAMQPETVEERGWGWYRCADYRELIDHPIGMGHFDMLEFDAEGVPHRVAVFGAQPYQSSRLAADMKAVCTQHVRQMGGAPHDRYLFLLRLGDGGDGGLEHAFSSTLATPRRCLPMQATGERSADYRRLLGLVSHEYFHLWNVKRIQPLQVADSSLHEEAFFDDLWAYEGVTSYLDDWTLRQAGVLTTAHYLDTLATALTRLSAVPGRMRQSLAEASFDAWIRLYKPAENSPNSTVSYYLKGALVALALDLQLRRSTDYTLLDVMRGLHARAEQNGPLPERALERGCIELAGAALGDFFERYVHSTDEPDFSELLAAFGVEARRGPARGLTDGSDRGSGRALRCELGVKLGSEPMHIATVEPDSPAELAGLSAGDTLLAWNGIRLDMTSLEAALREHEPGAELELHYFRDGRLRRCLVTPRAASDTVWTLSLAADADTDVVQRRDAWLGS